MLPRKQAQGLAAAVQRGCPDRSHAAHERNSSPKAPRVDLQYSLSPQQVPPHATVPFGPARSASFGEGPQARGHFRQTPLQCRARNQALTHQRTVRMAILPFMPGKHAGRHTQCSA